MATTIWPRRTVMLIATTVLITIALVLLVADLIGGEKKITQQVERLYSLDNARFTQELGALLGPPFVGGNRHQVLLNGDQIFPPMLAAIRSAQKSITFETYIYWSGDIGREFAHALAERARQGVKVHVLLDWVGSAKVDESFISELTAAGVEIRKFHPPHWTNLGRLNNRTHRKLLVVDGSVAFTGGAGIAPQWTGHAQDPQHWRDTHVQVQGPVVAQMQAVFLDNWIKVTGVVLHGSDYFPVLASAGDSSAQMFSSSPSGGSESMQLMYLLAAGAVIAEYRPTMYHCKVMIVDDLLVSMGSTNFDNRSFRLNDEATLSIVDAEFAKQQHVIFEADLALSRHVSYAQWKSRPLKEKTSEAFASLVQSQL